MKKTEVISFFHAQSNTFTHLIADADCAVAALIDSALDYDDKAETVSCASAEIIDAEIKRRGWDLQWILETHAHADHLTAAQWFKSRWPNASLGIGEGIRQVQRTFAPRYQLSADFRTDGSQFDRLFNDGDEFELGRLPVRIIAVPGHTSDSIAYLIGDALFPGDSLFMPDGGTARCDFPGGDAVLLFRSIQRLYQLPDATRVFICHDYGPNGRAVQCLTTIGEQRRNNIHIHDGVEEADYVALRRRRDATLAEPRLIGPSIKANIQAGFLHSNKEA